MRLGDEFPDVLECFLDVVDERRHVPAPTPQLPAEPERVVATRQMSATSAEFADFLTSVEVI